MFDPECASGPEDPPVPSLNEVMSLQLFDSAVIASAMIDAAMCVSVGASAAVEL